MASERSAGIVSGGASSYGFASRRVLGHHVSDLPICSLTGWIPRFAARARNADAGKKHLQSGLGSLFLQLGNRCRLLLFLCLLGGRRCRARRRHYILNIGWVVAGRRTAMQAQLSESAQIDRVAENPCRFLRGVEAHRVLGHYEIDHELSFALIIARRSQLGVCISLRLLGLDVSNQVHQGIERVVTQIKETVLNVFDSRLQLLFWKVMTRLA